MHFRDNTMKWVSMLALNFDNHSKYHCLIRLYLNIGIIKLLEVLNHSDCAQADKNDLNLL